MCLIVCLKFYCFLFTFGLLSNLVLSFKFSIVHNNDMHARYDPIVGTGQKCPKGDDERCLCFGGFARVATAVSRARAEGSVLYFNAGDTFYGTVWYAIYRAELAGQLMNMLNPDAMSLGNHEFDDNIAGLVPFLKQLNFPVVSCNLDLTFVPKLANIKQLVSSTIISRLDRRIGVIGYLTPLTKYYVPYNLVAYWPEIPAINMEAKKLRSAGVDIIIALGHSGYEVDMKIAKNCPDVDVVIGGHSHTFLYTGNPPVNDLVEGDYQRIRWPYPTWVTQKSGKRVPVVQAYAFTKYLGKLHVKFDAAGNLLEVNGAPILLDGTVAQDKDLLDVLELYRENVTALEKSILGHSKVHLEGRKILCRSVECNMGNLITDAMIFSRVMEDQGGDYWTDAAIAIHQGGGIRGSIERKSDGMITHNDLLTVLPFANDLYVTRISGRTLWQALEHAAALRFKDSDGAFLQMSGVRVVYNEHKPEGKRVVSVQVRCAACEVPAFSPLNESALYKVIVPQFLLDGGDGHVFTEAANPQSMHMQRSIIGAVQQYLQHRDFVYPGLESRITFIDAEASKSAATKISLVSSSASLLIVSTLIIFNLVL
ncbi:protein 5NUC-like isoform X2 [Drosophila busckii]|uniref:protein 5NUC-like isoform X2 n=1 Tax=Drosophila busckii TaxID=30019 RepID=UPI0014332070|nr:protein 5NUC-like isoform X2 [Drosophila busckii]